MKANSQNFKAFMSSGTPWVWLNAGAVAISMIMVVGLLLLIASRGLGHFWPKTMYEIEYDNGTNIHVQWTMDYYDKKWMPIADTLAPQPPCCLGLASHCVIRPLSLASYLLLSVNEPRCRCALTALWCGHTMMFSKNHVLPTDPMGIPSDCRDLL